MTLLNMDPEETKGCRRDMVFELVRKGKIQRIKNALL